MTSHTIRARSDDGHILPVYRSAPEGAPRASVIVVHEIFGLTPHIQSVCDRLAAMGYVALAPDLFSRNAEGIVLPYTKEGKDRGLAIKNAIGEERMASDVVAVAGALESPVGVIGFCLGGTVAWLSAAHSVIACAVGYYSVKIDAHLASAPVAPVLLHFGRTDPSIPASAVQAVRGAFPQVAVHEYDAGHAFNRDDDVSFNSSAAAEAWERTQAFLVRHLA